jgi:Na+/melibiose symporter-like transporter
MSDKVLARSQIFQYGFLALPVAFAGFPLYVLAPDFYATNYGISLAALGFILLFLRAFDAVQDPIIGMISDRFSAAIFPLIVASAICLVLSIYFLFHPLAELALFWFVICMLIAVTSYSILSINLNAVGALWTEDKNQQTRVSAVREAFALTGLLLAVSLPNILAKFIAAEEVFLWFTLLLALLMFSALVAFWRWFQQKPIALKKQNQSANILKILREIPAVTYRLYLVYGLSFLASSIPAVLVLFFVRDRLGAENYTGIFLLLYFLAGVLAMPIWKKLSEKYSKPAAWLLSILFAVVSFFWALFLNEGDIYQYAIICVISGMALGGDLALPPAILAEQIHAHDLNRTAATQFSLLALLSKFGLALASAITLPFLDFLDFVPAAQNSDESLLGLSVAYALLPCLIKLVAAYLLYYFFVKSTWKKNHEKSLAPSSNRSGNYA